jgi:hypothetical protein
MDDFKALFEEFYSFERTNDHRSHPLFTFNAYVMRRISGRKTFRYVSNDGSHRTAAVDCVHDWFGDCVQVTLTVPGALPSAVTGENDLSGLDTSFACFTTWEGYDMSKAWIECNDGEVSVLLASVKFPFLRIVFRTGRPTCSPSQIWADAASKTRVLADASAARALAAASKPRWRFPWTQA